MLPEFRQHISQNLGFLTRKKLLVACSGGIDSMVLADLLLQVGFDIGIAHCNFGLRGNESDSDENFVREFSLRNHLKAHVQKFDTKQFAADFGYSIQVAARELRYRYFYELLESEGYDFVLTAHHSDDNLETFLINLSRGSGIDGLAGIPVQNGKTVRPLLAFSRADIEAYAKSRNLEWREDSSNASDKYLRNQIRHKIIPELKQIRPDFLDSFSRTQEFLRQSKSMADDASALVFSKVARQFGSETRFSLDELKKLPNAEAYLYQWLNPYGFSAWKDILDLIGSQAGKQVFSQTHVLLKDRDSLILTPLENPAENREFRIYKGMEQIGHPIKISLKNAEKPLQNSNSAIFVDAEKLEFPLVLRKWKQGDIFHPAGMGGKSKKVSKYFKDEKFSLRDKENAWLLCSAGQIVWIVGQRADERFLANATTTNILQISVNE